MFDHSSSGSDGGSSCFIVALSYHAARHSAHSAASLCDSDCALQVLSLRLPGQSAELSSLKDALAAEREARAAADAELASLQSQLPKLQAERQAAEATNQQLQEPPRCKAKCVTCPG